MSDQPPQWGSGNTGDQGGYGGASDGGNSYPPPPPNNYGGGGQGGGQGPSATGVIIASVFGILCCLPLGIPALIYAINANNKSSSGDYAGANKDLSTAKKLAIAAIIAGILLLGLWAVLTFASLNAATNGYQQLESSPGGQGGFNDNSLDGFGTE